MSSDSEHDSQLSDSESSGPEAVPPRVFGRDYKLHENKFPTKDRIMGDVVQPAGNILGEDEFWDEDGNPNIPVIKDHLLREGRVGKKQLTQLIDRVYECYCAEDNVLTVDAPVTVCGDIHGQFYDLLRLFEVGGDPKTTSYIFLGDYVDRGYFSMECLILLFSYKITYPKTFFMLRGNHECRHLTDYFTFREETEHKYDRDIYTSIMDVFDALPIAAIMNKQFFCVHGGISPQIETVEDIRKIDRFIETPASGPMCDLLWADPMEDFNRETRDPFEPNSVRGCSFLFSYKAVCQFLEHNKLLSVIRAHEAQDSGYRMHRKVEKTGFPSVITLFSAPNYLDHYGNKGAILRYENNVINIRQFNHSPHPYWLPGFMNVFKWSLPFVAEKAGEIVMNVFRLVDDSMAEQQEEEEKIVQEAAAKKREQLRSKVLTVSRMLSLFRKMREEREQLVLAGAISPRGDSIPVAVQQQQEVTKAPLAESLKLGFNAVKSLDLPNEARPEGLEKTEKEVKIYMDSIQYQKRKSSRELTVSQKTRQEYRDLMQRKEREKAEMAAAANAPVPKINESQ